MYLMFVFLYPVTVACKLVYFSAVAKVKITKCMSQIILRLRNEELEQTRVVNVCNYL